MDRTWSNLQQFFVPTTGYPKEFKLGFHPRRLATSNFPKEMQLQGDQYVSQDTLNPEQREGSLDSTEYTFIKKTFNTMLLIPNLPGSMTSFTSPHIYHISLQMNHFSPSYWTTTIRRGESETGEFIGSFGAGTLVAGRNTVHIRGVTFPMEDILEFSNLCLGFKWKAPGKTLFWDDGDSTLTRTCYSSLMQSWCVVAKFIPAGLHQPGKPTPQDRLVIYAASHNLFDDILLTLLILERKCVVLAGRKSIDVPGPASGSEPDQAGLR